MADIDRGDVIKEAQRLLAIWGKWLRENNAQYRLGYPTSAAFIHAGEVRTTYQPDLCVGGVEANELAGAVEQVMCRLKRSAPTIFKAIVAWYALDMTNMDAAKHCRCSDRIYRSRRAMGEYYVAGSLDKINMKKGLRVVPAK